MEIMTLDTSVVHCQALFRLFQIATNLYVEVTTILRALQYCKVQGHERVLLEIDSLGMYKFISREWEIPWVIVQIVDEI